MKNTTELFTRVINENVDYFELESFLNKRGLENCRITVQDCDPNQLPMWKHCNPEQFSTEPGYVYEPTLIKFDSELTPSFKIILSSIEKQGLHIPLFDFLTIFEKNFSPWKFYMPYFYGEKIKLFKYNSDQQFNHYTKITNEDIGFFENNLRHGAKLLLSKNKVVPNSKEVLLVKYAQSIVAKTEKFLSPFYPDGFSVEEIIKLLKKEKEPYSTLEKIENSNKDLILFTKSIIEFKTKEISKAMESRYTPSSGHGYGNNGIH